ncbi:MAG: molecular chaperone [Desulfuromonadales bacterium]|nr:molecular chaperone [Desulfuromonadales bacterium]NIR33408.1 molecular chaperone [Desulfuromonadales bacterium]NIS43399.1 molecular chaperone [Desulfuromonadales bacterium]
MPRLIAYSLLTMLLFSALPAAAAEWRVVPIRVDLAKNHRSDVVRLINEGDERVSLQVEATEWTQDAQGQDRYVPSKDLVFFPNILTIEPKEERVLRTGLRSPAVEQEKTYRLFIEEIPDSSSGDATQVSINIRFGLPVFVEPLKKEVQAVISDLTLDKGRLAAEISNTGNVHVRINKLIVKGLDAEGEEIFREEKPGWYLLAGASRRHAIELPANKCRQAATLRLEVDTDKIDPTQSLAVEPDLCQP